MPLAVWLLVGKNSGGQDRLHLAGEGVRGVAVADGLCYQFAQGFQGVRLEHDVERLLAITCLQDALAEEMEHVHRDGTRRVLVIDDQNGAALAGRRLSWVAVIKI